MNSPLKWHGGKYYLAKRIIDLMPAHTHYVEPYAGSLAVLLAKDPEGVSEVANDIHNHLTNFWRVLISTSGFERLQRLLEATPFCEKLWRLSLERLRTPCGASEDELCPPCAFAFFICCRQSMAGRMESFAPLSKARTRRGMNEQVSAWLSAVEGLPEVHKRLKRVVVLNSPALEVITREDSPRTLFYLDPPYVPDTRTAPNVYRHEMSVDDHLSLLNTIKECQGKVMISGYPTDLYDQVLKTWSRHEWDMANHAASAGGIERKQKARMTECLWCNF